MGIKRVSHVTIVVRGQEEALRWYTEKLGFEKRVDNSGTIPGFRWLTVTPRGEAGPEIVLYQARNENDSAQIGRGTMWVLETDNYRETCERLAAKGVEILSPAQEVPWGVSAIFQDLYGNRFNLGEPRSA